MHPYRRVDAGNAGYSEPLGALRWRRASFLLRGAHRCGAAGGTCALACRSVRCRDSGRSSDRPRRRRHERRDRGVCRGERRLYRRVPGFRRFDQPADHRRRGGTFGQRYDQGARPAGRTRADPRRLSRRRTHQRTGPGRHHQGRPAAPSTSSPRACRFRRSISPTRRPTSSRRARAPASTSASTICGRARASNDGCATGSILSAIAIRSTCRSAASPF